MERQEVIIVSFSKGKSGEFDETNLVYKNLLLGSFFSINTLEIEWVKKFLSAEVLMKKFKNNDRFFSKVFDEEYLARDKSIRWLIIFGHISNNHDKKNELIKKIDRVLSSMPDCKFIGFQQFSKSQLFYFNTDQLYEVSETESEKPYFPDFLVKAWCDAYGIRNPDGYKFKLVIHDKEVDGIHASAPKYYDYCCELRGDLFVPCKIVTFSHSNMKKEFIAIMGKSFEQIIDLFQGKSYARKEGFDKCSESVKAQIFSVNEIVDESNRESNMLNTFRLSRSGETNILNYIIEELQNSIFEMTLLKSKSETTIKLADYENEDIMDLIKMIATFHSKITVSLEEKKIIVSERKVKEFHIYLCSMLEKIKPK